MCGNVQSVNYTAGANVYKMFIDFSMNRGITLIQTSVPEVPKEKISVIYKRIQNSTIPRKYPQRVKHYFRGFTNITVSGGPRFGHAKAILHA